MPQSCCTDSSLELIRQVQGLRCGGPIAPCGQGCHQFSRLCVNNAIRGDDILQSGDVVNGARLPLHLILRLVDWGGIATGLFGMTSINGVAKWNGLVFGETRLFVAQIIGILYLSQLQ